MTVETRIYYRNTSGNLSLVDTTTSASVSLRFVGDTGLQYFKDSTYHLVNEIQSDVDSGSPASLDITITNGSSWYIEGSEKEISISGGPSSGGIRWVYGGSDMAVNAWYPSRTYAEIRYDLYDPDAPPVKLTVVVKRVP
jgi:hypothetical protein